MAEAVRDENFVPVKLITSNSDGVTPLLLQVNPSIHAIKASDGTTGSDLSDHVARRDKNFVPVLMGISSADGKTPIPIYGDLATGFLLIKST